MDATSDDHRGHGGRGEQRRNNQSCLTTPQEIIQAAVECYERARVLSYPCQG